ncbi:MAG: DUF1854 domain-containing protein [Akkermansiaceae bacterium]|nr:DUF1854 domain-containing protein [Armatimonadota bacterium]
MNETPDPVAVNPSESTPSTSTEFERETQVVPDETHTDLGTLRLFYQPAGTVRLTVGETHSYHSVKLYQSAPLSLPKQYISLQSGKSEEILMVHRLEDLSPESRIVAEEELRRRYLTAQVEKVTEVRTEFGITYWHVETDKGERDFVVQSLSESCLWLSDDHILLTDADGNRFEIASRAALDAHSQAQLDSVL